MYEEGGRKRLKSEYKNKNPKNPNKNTKTYTSNHITKFSQTIKTIEKPYKNPENITFQRPKTIDKNRGNRIFFWYAKVSY